MEVNDGRVHVTGSGDGRGQVGGRRRAGGALWSRAAAAKKRAISGGQRCMAGRERAREGVRWLENSDAGRQAGRQAGPSESAADARQRTLCANRRAPEPEPGCSSKRALPGCTVHTKGHFQAEAPRHAPNTRRSAPPPATQQAKQDTAASQTQQASHAALRRPSYRARRAATCDAELRTADTVCMCIGQAARANQVRRLSGQRAAHSTQQAGRARTGPQFWRSTRCLLRARPPDLGWSAAGRPPF